MIWSLVDDSDRPQACLPWRLQRSQEIPATKPTSLGATDITGVCFAEKMPLQLEYVNQVTGYSAQSCDPNPMVQSAACTATHTVRQYRYLVASTTS